ncbi:hypothetical protein [Streptomyces sp. BE133]|uniref:hypothetical protein n=1 Tax=Streptomyces sp. BE133 TaxID=3002523 RepID=UPI002E7A3C22|nr:hypothetical protein [Streptomyces sp. BE133]MEE1811229.1 hypothetical protein [Streptomyces sp. BE133]
MPRTGASRSGRLSSGLLPKCPAATPQMLVIKDFVPDETFDAYGNCFHWDDQATERHRQSQPQLWLKPDEHPVGVRTADL